LYNFTIGGLTQVGDSVAVVIPMSTGEKLKENAVYRKYNTTNGWYTFIEDENNSTSSALADENGNCPAANDEQYTLGLQQGDNCIQLLIEDGGPNDADFAINGSVEDPGAIMTEYQNQAPIIALAESYESDEEVTITLDASATTDEEGDTLTYHWAQLSGESVELTTVNEATLTFVTPSVSQDEVLVFELTVDDGSDSSSQSVEVSVYQVNKAPTVTIDSHSETVTENDSLTLTAQGNDVDGESLTYLWEQISGPTISFDDATLTQVSLTLPEVDADSLIEVKVTVSDGQLSTTSETSFTVTNEVEVIVVTPETKNSSGGTMAWLLVLLFIQRVFKSERKLFSAR